MGKMVSGVEVLLLASGRYSRRSYRVLQSRMARDFRTVLGSQTNDGHHPARASKVSMLKTADRVLGVHGLVRHYQRNARHVKLIRGPASF